MSAPTLQNPAIRIAGSPAPLVERGAGGESSQTGTFPVQSAPARGEQVRSWIRASVEYLTPPAVLTDRPASVAELAAYARHAGWTAQGAGPVRAAGVAWWRLVGLPATVVCRYAEWIAQRPGRAIPVFVMWKAVITTGGGPWFVDNVLAPVGQAAAWILF